MLYVPSIDGSWFWGVVMYVAYSKDTLCVGLARVGHDDQVVVSGTLEQMQHVCSAVMIGDPAQAQALTIRYLRRTRSTLEGRCIQ